MPQSPGCGVALTPLNDPGRLALRAACRPPLGQGRQTDLLTPQFPVRFPVVSSQAPSAFQKPRDQYEIGPQKCRGAHARIRTGDLFLTKEMLYRLSYVGAL